MWKLAALAQTLKTKLSSINVPDGDVQTPSLEGRLLAGIVLVVIAAVAVAGCANSEAAKRAAAQAAFQAKIKADNAECQSYGAKPGSDDYVQCRLAIDVRKANAEAADEAARQQALTRP